MNSPHTQPRLSPSSPLKHQPSSARLTAGTASSEDEIVTPALSPFTSVVNVGVVSSDIDPPPATPADDEFRTPVPLQEEFGYDEADGADTLGTPGKPRSLSRAVGKAKGFVKSLVHRRSIRKVGTLSSRSFETGSD